MKTKEQINVLVEKGIYNPFCNVRSCSNFDKFNKTSRCRKYDYKQECPILQDNLNAEFDYQRVQREAARISAIRMYCGQG